MNKDSTIFRSFTFVLTDREMLFLAFFLKLIFIDIVNLYTEDLSLVVYVYTVEHNVVVQGQGLGLDVVEAEAVVVVAAVVVAEVEAKEAGKRRSQLRNLTRNWRPIMLRL